MDFTYFNPRLQHEPDFLANFIARHDVLDFFLRQLRLTPLGRPARHHLVVAPRGYGKTSLLRRIAIAVRTESDLNERFIALSFREEQHNVISLDVFWRNCLQSLLEVREDEGAPQSEIQQLDAAWDRHAPRQSLKREDQDGEPAWHEFQNHCSSLNRRPLLLIDNLDALLAGLDKNHEWALRRIMQRDDGPMLIAAASRYPDSTHDPNSAFFEFFRMHTLDRLSDLEVTHCLRMLAAHRGDAGRAVAQLLERDPGRVSALNGLAGGNPRTLNVLYGVLETHMSDDVLSQLRAMLDTFTGWYQARTEELPMQSRAVFDALALNWNPMTAAALGEITGLDTTAVSSQLSRLEKAGYVESVALNTRGKGRNGYQVSERFFNIWYLMRNGPRRAQQSIKFLTEFLRSCFSLAERRSMARDGLAGRNIDPGYAVALANTLRRSRLKDSLLDHAEFQSNCLGKQEEYGAAIKEIRRLDIDRHGNAWTKPGDPRKPMTERFNLVEEATETVSPCSAPVALLEEGYRLQELGRLEEAVEVYDEVVRRFGDAAEPALREWVARALVHKAITLDELDRAEDVIGVCDDMVQRFGDATEPVLREGLALALVAKGIRLGELGRVHEAIEVFDDAVRRFGDGAEPLLRESVAKALASKGSRLGELGRPDEEIEVYDDVVRRFGGAAEPVLREEVVRALVNKGITLGERDRAEEAIEVFDDVVGRFGDAAEPALREGVARALASKGFSLGELGRAEDAIEVYDEVDRRFRDAAERALRERVAEALVNKGFRLRKLGRAQDAIEVYDDVARRFGDAAEPALRERVAQALINKGFSLGALGRAEEAIEVYDDVVRRFGDAAELVLREEVARALENKSITLGELGRAEAAIKVYDEMIQRFGDAAEPALREQVATACMSKGNALLDLIGAPSRAIEAYAEGISVGPLADTLALLHANCAYALALHGGDPAKAIEQIPLAGSDESTISTAGRHLLGALSFVCDPKGIQWPQVFEKINDAVCCEDDDLWSSYLDDLQRLLWFVLAHDQGGALSRWMEEAQYPMRYAPLYHALIAAIDGEDHLLRINPETRQPASRIYEGIARLVQIYGGAGKHRDAKRRT